MERADRTILFSLLAITATLFICLVGVTYARSHRAHTSPILLKSVDPRVVIGRSADASGRRDTQYTLVEFGDYQCPACRAAYREFSNLPFPLQHQIRFVFRNHPLVGHALAWPAAEAAERARIHGRFGIAFALLFAAGDLTPNSIRTVDSRIRSSLPNLADDTREVRRRIRQDIDDALRLGADWTPAFYLCTESGQVFLVPRVRQLPELIESLECQQR